MLRHSAEFCEYILFFNCQEAWPSKFGSSFGGICISVELRSCKEDLLARIIRYVLLAGNGACTFAPFNSTCVFLPPSFLVVKKVGLFSSWALLGSEYSEC